MEGDEDMRTTKTRKAVATIANCEALTYREVRDHVMAGYVADVVRHCGGDKHIAAELLDISYSLVKEKTRTAYGDLDRRKRRRRPGGKRGQRKGTK
jgi:hypothetical protein